MLGKINWRRYFRSARLELSPPNLSRLHNLLSKAKMAEFEERSPMSVGTADSLRNAVVTLIIPELRTGYRLGLEAYFQGQPKNAETDIKFQPRSVQVELKVTTKNAKIKYTYIVNKLPGEIHPDKCIKKFYRGKVVLVLVKANEESWEATLSSTGLDLE